MTLTNSVRKSSFEKVKSEGKITTQADIIYNLLSGFTSLLTAWEVYDALQLQGKPMLITSIRRSLNTLHEDKRIVAVDTITEKYGSKNTRWKIVPKQESLF